MKPSGTMYRGGSEAEPAGGAVARAARERSEQERELQVRLRDDSASASGVIPPKDAPLSYIIHGAGAIGCVLAARLATAGRKVALVARGGHLAALQRDGLRIGGRTDGHFRLPAARTAHELDLDANTVVLLAM
ncbi:MAG: hypothetical protein OXF61_15435, partial [Acidimicrobiaceae bacterium]|nr:hypothetical protein [Acidimicrobiaceae bacterium]